MKITKSQLKRIIKEELGIMESDSREQRVHNLAVEKIKGALEAIQQQFALEAEAPNDEEFAWALHQVAANWDEDVV